MQEKTKAILQAAQKAHDAASLLMLRQMAEVIGDEHFDGNKIDGIVLGIAGAAIEMYHDMVMKVFGKEIGDQMAMQITIRIAEMATMLPERKLKDEADTGTIEAREAIRVAAKDTEAMEAIAKVKMTGIPLDRFISFVRTCESTKLVGAKLGYAFKRVCAGDPLQLVQKVGTQALADEVNNYGPFALAEKVQAAA